MTKAEREEKLKEEYLNIKISFNDYCMREIGLGLDDNDRLVDDDVESILKFKDKFIVYNDTMLDPYVRSDEIDMNLLENYKLMELLFQVYITKYRSINPIDVKGFLQRAVTGTDKVVFSLMYLDHETNLIKHMESDPYRNGCVSIFNLICKLAKRDNIYDFEKLDIMIDKDLRKKWRYER